MTDFETATLSAGSLACGDCGREVTEPDPTTVVPVEFVRGGLVTRVPMAKCPQCVARDHQAAEHARQHLPIGVTVGQFRYSGRDAERLLVDAWVAYEAAGVQPPTIKAVGPHALLTAQVEHLSGQTGWLRWRDMVNPIQSLVADPVRVVEPGTANRERWAHVDEDHRARLLQCAGRVLAQCVALLAPDVELTPPDERDPRPAIATGCLYCGVGCVRMTALEVHRHGGARLAARAVWSRRSVRPSTLGPHADGPDRLVGWLCPNCSQAADDIGSADSVTAVEEVLSRHLGVSRHTMAGDEVWVTGLWAWGALAVGVGENVTGPVANKDPWGHLSAIERGKLREAWRRGGD